MPALLLRGRGDADVGAQFFEARLRDAVDGEQVFDPLQRAAFFAEPDDGFCGTWTNSGQLLELLDSRGVQINWLGRRLFLCCGNALDKDDREQGERD